MPVGGGRGVSARRVLQPLRLRPSWALLRAKSSSRCRARLPSRFLHACPRGGCSTQRERLIGPPFVARSPSTTAVRACRCCWSPGLCSRVITGARGLWPPPDHRCESIFPPRPSQCRAYRYRRSGGASLCTRTVRHSPRQHINPAHARVRFVPWSFAPLASPRRIAGVPLSLGGLVYFTKVDWCDGPMLTIRARASSRDHACHADDGRLASAGSRSHRARRT